MKRAYLANGNLVATATAKDSVLHVDSGLFSYLENLLAGDYCYLTLNNTEVVKVLSVEAPNSVLVKRSVGGSRVYAAIGSSLVYRLTKNEIEDSVIETVLLLAAEGTVRIVDNQITYPEYTFKGLGGIEISGTSDVLITDISENASCGECVPPEIPTQFQPYRIIDSGELRITDDGSIRSYI